MYLASGMKCTLEDLTAIYADRKVAQVILDSATHHGTIAKIESGECTLPNPDEAREYARQLGIQAKFGKSSLARAMSDNPLLHNYLTALEERLVSLEEKGGK